MSNLRIWMTSGEHPGWHIPRAVRVEDTGSGPDSARTYAMIRVLSADPEGGEQVLAVSDRFDVGWHAPETGRRREVAVWRLDRPGVIWVEHALVGADAGPDAWCTLCATEGEADDIAANMERQIQRAGW